MKQNKQREKTPSLFYRTGTFSFILKEARMITAFFVQLILIRKRFSRTQFTNSND